MVNYLSHIVSKPTRTRFAQGPFWQNFFDTLLNLEGGEKKCLPNLLDMAERCREAFKKGEGMQKGLDKARELLQHVRPSAHWWIKVVRRVVTDVRAALTG